MIKRQNIRTKLYKLQYKIKQTKIKLIHLNNKIKYNFKYKINKL